MTLDAAPPHVLQFCACSTCSRARWSAAWSTTTTPLATQVSDGRLPVSPRYPELCFSACGGTTAAITPCAEGIAAAGAPHRHPRAVPAPHPLRLCPLESQAAMAAWPSTARRARRAARCSSASQTCWFPALACIALAAAFTSTSRRLMRFDPAIQVRPGVRRRVTGWRRQRRGDLVSVRQR